jgi:glycine cleavage system H protein
MAKPLVFMMGRSPTFLPTDRRYARNHLWAEALEGSYRFGFSAYAVKLLGEIYHLQWSIAPGAEVQHGQQIGFIEASKATSDLYAPASGRIQQINAGVLATPDLINTNPYDTGWLFCTTAGDESFLSTEEYLAYLETCWPLAQRLLKGQAGR